MEAKMKTKNLLVSFCVAAIFLFAIAFVSAATVSIATIDSVEINGVENDNLSGDIGVVAGETLTVKVLFTADEDASDVRIQAEVRGSKIDVDTESKFFDIEQGNRYLKTLKLVLPYELKDEVSDDLELNIEIWNKDFSTQHDEITLKLQRDSYKAEVVSIDSPQTAEAGEILPVDVVVKNVGYNKLDDLYVTLRIPELGLERESYFGDIVAVETDDDDDFLRGRFYLRIPYKTVEGIYTIEVQAMNDEMDLKASKQIILKNDFSSGNVIATNLKQIAATGENADYELLLVNPTNKLKVYTVITEYAGSNLHTSASSTLVSVPAGLSRTVTITANAVEEGEYLFNTNILSGEKVESVVTFGLTAEGNSVNGVAVLTVILAIIFIVLLVVLVVLLGKKPKKSEDFGESYY